MFIVYYLLIIKLIIYSVSSNERWLRLYHVSTRWREQLAPKMTNLVVVLVVKSKALYYWACARPQARLFLPKHHGYTMISVLSAVMLDQVGSVCPPPVRHHPTLLRPTMLDDVGRWTHLARLTTSSDLLQVVPTSLISPARNKLLPGWRRQACSSSMK